MIFKEKQRFRDHLAYVLVGLFIVMSAIGFISFMTMDGGPYYTRGFVCLAIMVTLFLGLIYLQKLKLKVNINDDRIKYKLSPFHRHAHRISWEKVESCELVKTPLRSRWHGSNIHFLNEIMYSLNGRNGLSIKTHDGRHYFIGIKNLDALKDEFKEAKG